MIIFNDKEHKVALKKSKYVFKMLLLLAKNTGKAVSYEKLYKFCWGSSVLSDTYEQNVRFQKNKISRLLESHIDKSLGTFIQDVNKAYRINSFNSPHLM